MACGAKDGTPVHLEAAPIPNATRNAITIFNFLPPSTTVGSEDFFHPEYDLVALRPIPDAKLVIAVCVEEPFPGVPYQARTYRRHLLRRVRERNAIDTAIGDLP